LEVYSSRPDEFTGQTLACADVGKDTTGSHALELVLAVPGYKVAVVDKICFTVRKLDIPNS
jgi:hypothetical protein